MRRLHYIYIYYYLLYICFLLVEDGEEPNDDDGAMRYPSEERSECADQSSASLRSSHQADGDGGGYWDCRTCVR